MKLPAHAFSTRRSAATLVEILVVISVIIVLTGLSFYAFSVVKGVGDRVETQTQHALGNIRAARDQVIKGQRNDVGTNSVARPQQAPSQATPNYSGNQGQGENANDSETPGSDIVPDQFLVYYRASVSDYDAQAQRLAALVGGEVRHVYNRTMPGFAVKCAAAKIDRLRKDAAVKMIEPDRYLTPCAATPTNIRRVFSNTDNTGTKGAKAGKTLPSFIYQNFRTTDRPNILSGRVFVHQYTGALTPVAVLDSGIDNTHPDLFVVGSVDFTSSSTLDTDGHGTHVAGIIGARNNLANGGTVGVYPGAPMFSVKITTKTGGPFAFLSDVNAGLQYVAANAAKFRVGVILLQSAGVINSLNSFMDAAANSGVLMVSAAGNIMGAGVPVAASTSSPGSASQAICVGGLSDTDGLPWGLGGGKDDIFDPGSNFGPRVDFAAPSGAGSGGIYSTIPLAGMVANGLKTPYSFAINGKPGPGTSGTSFSAAHVAGMLAYALDEHTTVGFVTGGRAIPTFRPLMTNRAGAINALMKLTHRSGYYNDVVVDGTGTTIPVANFYCNHFLP